MQVSRAREQSEKKADWGREVELHEEKKRAIWRASWPLYIDEKRGHLEAPGRGKLGSVVGAPWVAGRLRGGCFQANSQSSWLFYMCLVISDIGWRKEGMALEISREIGGRLTDEWGHF